MPVLIERMSAIVRFCFPLSTALSKFGIAMAAMMPMIATTISSSTRVNPFGDVFTFIGLPTVEFGFQSACHSSKHRNYRLSRRRGDARLHRALGGVTLRVQPGRRAGPDGPT